MTFEILEVSRELDEDPRQSERAAAASEWAKSFNDTERLASYRLSDQSCLSLREYRSALS